MPHMARSLSGPIAVVVALLSAAATVQQSRSGNPILRGWYADPEAHVFNGRYWIFPTYSAPYDRQVFFDAFSSPDLVAAGGTATSPG